MAKHFNEVAQVTRHRCWQRLDRRVIEFAANLLGC
jgi:hypothetical protein